MFNGYAADEFRVATGGPRRPTRRSDVTCGGGGRLSWRRWSGTPYRSSGVRIGRPALA